MDESDVEYAGFWIRVGAAIIDTLLIVVVTYPLLVSIYGWKYLDTDKMVAGPADFLISWVFPAIAVIWFWTQKQATPGKAALSLRVLDAGSGENLSIGQSIGRYLAYFVSIIPLGLGLIWVGFDRKKQGWHDKLAHTVVVRAKNHGPEPVRFPQA
ncbi:MAG TPA: RDD family protein [Rhodoferax sp.]|nr:RDD family protein [Rhodoferax sp.]